MKLSASKLQAALDALSSANTRAAIARNKIYAHCEVTYGFTPGEVDNDEFIDSCDGGCGVASGMTATEFEASMLRAIWLKSRG